MKSIILILQLPFKETKEHLYNIDIECKKQFDLLMKQYIENQKTSQRQKDKMG